MRAFTLDSFGAQPALRDDIPEPDVGDSQMLVRVHASSVNPVDVFMAAGALKEMAQHEFPVILGRDFAGVVEQVGSAVSRYRIGDEVFGCSPSRRTLPAEMRRGTAPSTGWRRHMGPIARHLLSGDVVARAGPWLVERSTAMA